MADAGNTLLRHSFDEVALLYKETRPRYPGQLFSVLIDITGKSTVGPATLVVFSFAFIDFKSPTKNS
jgi:hypothetical protein